LKKKPENPHQHIANLLNSVEFSKSYGFEPVIAEASGSANVGKRASVSKPSYDDDDSEDDDDDDDYDDATPLPEMKINKNRQARRISVSASVLDPSKLTADFKPKVFDKTDSEKAKIRSILGEASFLAGLNSQQWRTIIDAFEQETFEPNTDIITQGDTRADFFYCMSEGAADVLIDGEKVVTYGSDSHFGDLALLYNAPRAATIKSTEKCVCYRLDRMTFKTIVVAGVEVQRRNRVKFLGEVEIFQQLNENELNQLADACKEEVHSSDQEIIKQGDPGDKFYILEIGKVSFIKDGCEVGAAESGTTFGELALIKAAPRQVTVKTMEECTLHVVEIGAFKRILGPIGDILTRQYEESKTAFN